MTFVILAVILLVSAGGLFYAFQKPSFVAGLSGFLVRQAISALKPSWEKYKAKHTPEEWAAIRERYKRSLRGDK